MGKVYDALLRAESKRSNPVRMIGIRRASPVSGDARDPAARAPDTHGAASVSPDRAIDAPPTEPTTTERDIVERLASLEVAVYALLDQFEDAAEPTTIRGSRIRR